MLDTVNGWASDAASWWMSRTMVVARSAISFLLFILAVVSLCFAMLFVLVEKTDERK